MIRDQNTRRADFIFYSNRINRLLVEEALNHLPVLPHTITTPVGRTYAGVKFEGKICGVSIMRAGEAMEQALRECCRSVRIGKILIQRDEETSQPRLFYDKLPGDIKDRWVLLLDPMLATGEYLKVAKSGVCRRLTHNIGGSALMAVDVLLKKGVPEDHILFLNLIASPEGATKFAQKFPKVRIVTAFVDQGLNEKKLVSRCEHIYCYADSTSQLHCARSRRLRRQVLHAMTLACSLCPAQIMTVDTRANNQTTSITTHSLSLLVSCRSLSLPRRQALRGHRRRMRWRDRIRRRRRD